jgi:hypothetical protein
MRYHIPKHLYSSKEVEEKVDKGKEADESEHTSRSSPRSGAPPAPSSSASSQLEINLTQKQCTELEDRIKELEGKVIGIGYDRLRNCIYIQVGTATKDRSDTHIFVIDAASSQIKYYG